MKLGIFPDITRAEYDAMVERVNWSMLKLIDRSPRHFRHAINHPRKDTAALAFGRLVHLAVLEPELLDSSVAVWTGGRKTGKAWEEFQACAEGREIVSQDDLDKAKEIAAAVHADPTAAGYLKGGKAEATVLWTHRETVPMGAALDPIEFHCKARLDYLTDDAIVDLKSVVDASPDGFGRACWNFGYHIQAAFYADGVKAATGRELPYIFVAVEKEAPYVVQVYRVPDWILDHGRQSYRAMLRLLDTCMREQSWPGYAEGELELSLPRWAVQPPDDTDLADTGITFGGA